MAPALFACVMLFVNAAVRWSAWRDASDAAGAAARAATQPEVTDYNNGQIALGGAARARAQQVLSASGYSGSVQIRGDEVIVEVVADVDYIFPIAPFGSTVTGSGTSEFTVTGDS